MHATKDFETKLIEQKVSVISITAPNRLVIKATGYIGKIFLQWNSEGKCTYCKVPVPAYDLKF